MWNRIIFKQPGKTTTHSHCVNVSLKPTVSFSPYFNILISLVIIFGVSAFC